MGERSVVDKTRFFAKVIRLCGDRTGRNRLQWEIRLRGWWNMQGKAR